jgi:hypothetical protein
VGLLKFIGFFLGVFKYKILKKKAENGGFFTKKTKTKEPIFHQLEVA